MTNRKVVAIGCCLLLAGCGGTAKADAGKTTHPVVQAAAVSAPPMTMAEACRNLNADGALKSLEGFVIVYNVLKPGDMDQTVLDLQNEAEYAPTEMATALANLTEAAQTMRTDLDSGALNQTIDTSHVQPDANLIAGMCRSRGLDVPSVS